jgi:Holliday junction resolvase-like predicted endonuclease
MSLKESSSKNSTWRMVETRRKARRTIGILGLCVVADVAVSYFLLPKWLWPIFALITLWAVDHFFIGWMDLLFKREGDARRGAEAEDTVGAFLNRLPADSHVVLHDIPAQYGNIDHIVFRKDGAVLLVETKSHKGRIDERRANEFVPQTHRNLYWLSDFLKPHCDGKPWVSAAIVFPNAFVSVRRSLRGVDVVNLGFLEGWMKKQPGNAQIARSLWPRMEQVKQELQERRGAEFSRR